MSCKSALYAVNTAEQAVALGGVISIGSAVRRFGCHANAVGGNAVIKGVGYYDITASFGIEGVAGTVTITLYKDGVAIPGASATLTTEAATDYSVVIPAIVRSTCDCESTITAVLTGAAVTITNAAIRVEKI